MIWPSDLVIYDSIKRVVRRTGDWMAVALAGLVACSVLYASAIGLGFLVGLDLAPAQASVADAFTLPGGVVFVALGGPFGVLMLLIAGIGVGIDYVRRRFRGARDGGQHCLPNSHDRGVGRDDDRGTD